uniref:Uncharacterized protein n=1 Tax=Pundamilia nyererei TaxID=303518 RepID=A0A3B4H1D5_9CICH
LSPHTTPMAAPAVLRSSGPLLCPSFAEVCSFLERYGAALDLPEMTFPQMERYLRDTTTGESPVDGTVSSRLLVLFVCMYYSFSGYFRPLSPHSGDVS